MGTRKISICFIAAAFFAAALIFAGCGGGSGGGGEPARLVPANAPVYLQANLAPGGETSKTLNEVAQSVLGIDNVGDFIAEEVEASALGEGNKVDFAEEIEPWLGEKAALYLAGYDKGTFHGVGIVVETTDSGEAEEFLQEKTKGDDGIKEGEFEGHKYYEDPESIVGMVGDYIAFSQTKGDFEEMVKASEGEGLSESEKYEQAMDNAPEEGIGSAYVDIGGLIREAKSILPEESEAFFELLGIEPQKATAVATVIPHSRQLEIDTSSNLGSRTPEVGDATAALEALPASATVAFASADFGESLKKLLDLSEEEGQGGGGKGGEPPATVTAMRTSLGSIAEYITGAAGFIEGSTSDQVGGGLMIDASSAEDARTVVASVGLLLRSAKIPGVKKIGGGTKGFVVRFPKLAKPMIVGSAGAKIVIAYGPKAAATALKSQSQTLGSTPGFEAAKKSLGSTPMSAFVSGDPMLSLVESLLPPAERAELEEAKPFLDKIDYLGVGSEAEGGTQTAKLIIGLAK